MGHTRVPKLVALFGPPAPSEFRSIRAFRAGVESIAPARKIQDSFRGERFRCHKNRVALVAKMPSAPPTNFSNASSSVP
jgi:hypothetical protein